MAQLAFDIDGVKEMSRDLEVLVTNIPKLNTYFNTAQDIIDARIDDIFDKQGASLKNNPVWPALKPSTVKARQNRTGYYRRPPKGTPKILHWTGNLQDNRIRRVGKDFVETELAAPYAVYHFRGGPNLAARKVVELDQATITELERALQVHIDKTIGISGLQV